MSEPRPTSAQSNPPPESTTCCIVGGGPAGVVLALLLARQGLAVTLLEAHQDFDRDFRGDTLHAAVLENLAQIGLAQSVLARCQAQLSRLRFQTRDAALTIADFSRLKTPFPYVAMIPQATFLDFLVKTAQNWPNFRLLLGARAEALLESDGVVRGVQYRLHNRRYTLPALLTVAADGRGSHLRLEAGLELTRTAPPMDVVWFRLPPTPQTAGVTDITARFGSGTLLILIDRGQYWQAGYVILKGDYHDLRQAGLPAFRQALLALAPEFAASLDTLTDWHQCAVLNVQTGRLTRWYKPGLLLIGDAAHVMSPIGGVGINYAIQDAVAAANVLIEPLRAGQVDTSHLAAVQRRRQWPTAFMQGIQAYIQQRVIASALNTERPFRLPLPLRLVSRLPVLQAIPARIMAYGVRHERIQQVQGPAV